VHPYVFVCVCIVSLVLSMFSYRWFVFIIWDTDNTYTCSI
jgi:hypothetical protein